MSNEHTPLLTSGVCGLAVGMATVCGRGQPGESSPAHAGAPKKEPRKLDTFFGVMVPTVLSMFSIVLFLRTGFIVGHAGLLQGLLMLVVAYTIISLTILSICAISTNGAIKGGGAYYMISRSLGPEFGGSIGLMFFLAKVCACGVYVLGLVEAILNVFGIEPDAALLGGVRVLPQGYWYNVLYSAVVLLLCLLVCLVGAHIYARTAFVILLVVNVTLLSILISPLAVPAQDFNITHHGPGNQTRHYDVSYTGFNATTLGNNLWRGYTLDYSTNSVMSFATVFAVMFTSCTGIMAGANMSGYTSKHSSDTNHPRVLQGLRLGSYRPFTHELRINSGESGLEMIRCGPFTHANPNRRSDVFTRIGDTPKGRSLTFEFSYTSLPGIIWRMLGYLCERPNGDLDW